MEITDSQRLMAKRVLGNTQGKLLRRGSRGVSVRALQAFLADQGFDTGKLDGIFGKRTSAALKAFQESNGLTRDGKAGSQTFGKVRELMPDLAEPVADVDLPMSDVELPEPAAAELPEPLSVQSPTEELAPPELATGVLPDAMPGVSSPPESAPRPPLSPFDDETFSPAAPDLGARYEDMGRSDPLGQAMDQGQSAMTGEPYPNVAAERRMNVPEGWQPQPGDGLDDLRSALLGKISQQQPKMMAGPPQMNDMIRALMMGR